MAIDEETNPKFMQDLSAGLAAAAAANAGLLLPTGAGKEMKKLSESIQQIAISLKDARARSERKGTPSAAWFRELKGILYEIDSILRSFSPAGIDDHRQLPERRTAMQLKAIGSRLNKITKKQNLAGGHHQHTADNEAIRKMSVQNCPLEPIALMGKDEQDREKIIELLLSARESEQAGPSIIPIDRKGGAGGTTELARSVFDDKRVKNHFTRRIWVDASEIVDPAKLSELVSKPASTVFWAHRTVGVDSEEQVVLLVLDDVRNKRRVELRGSWIRDDGREKRPWIITNSLETKRKVVISTTKELNGDPFYPADAGEETPSRHAKKRLSAEESWAIFKEVALVGGRRPELEAIGRDIVGNLGESRAMISKMGSVLSANMEPRYWKMMLQSHVWKLPVDEELSQPTLAELCYHPSLPRCQYSRERYCGGGDGKPQVQSMTSLYWKRSRASV